MSSEAVYKFPTLIHGVFLLTLFLLVTRSHLIRASAESSAFTSRSQISIPLLYLGSHNLRCRTNSPEHYYWEVASKSLSTLHEETNGFLGILMDKLETSTSDLEEEEREKLEKQWLYVMETIQNSLGSTMDRIQHSWALIVAVADTQPLPWEKGIQGFILKEFINDLEYQYAMVAAIVKAGTKEIVGTLQYQVTNAIQKLEKHVSQLTKNGEDVTEIKLLEKMEKSFAKMKPNFISSLLKRLVKRAIAGRMSQRDRKEKASRVYFSNIMEQTAIVFEAFRQKGDVYPKFWSEITLIMKSEMESNLDAQDMSEFIRKFSSNDELFIENVFAILTSSIPDPAK